MVSSITFGYKQSSSKGRGYFRLILRIFYEIYAFYNIKQEKKDFVS